MTHMHYEKLLLCGILGHAPLHTMGKHESCFLTYSFGTNGLNLFSFKIYVNK